MRSLVAAAGLAGTVAFIAVLALHAPGPAVSVAAVAGATALAAWLSSAQSTPDEAGLVLSSPAWALALTLRRRRRYADLLPLWASQVVGALVAGLAAQALQARLPDPIVWPSPDPVATGVVALVLGVVGGWVVVAVDSFLGESVTALPVLAAGAALPLNLTGLTNPAVVFGVAVAGLLDWQTAAIAVLAVLAGTVVATWTAGPFIATPEADLTI